MFLILRYKMRKPSSRSKIAATIATAGVARVQEIDRPGNSSSRLRLRNRIAPAERHLGFWTPEQAFLSSGVNERLGSMFDRQRGFRASKPASHIGASPERFLSWWIAS